MSVTEMIKWLDGRIRFDFSGFVHLNEAAAIMLREAKELIERIGTTGVERTEIIQRAERWLKE